MSAEGLLAVGVDHRSAPVEVRERLALDPDGIERHLRRLCGDAICEEALIVSTCNRVEIYAVPTPKTAQGIAQWLGGLHGASVERHLVWRHGREAVVHLFRVAASLDSLVVGEPQILGQVKAAVRSAEASGSLGRVLSRLSHKALHVAKRIRTETPIGRFRVGVGNAGVDLALQIFGELKGKKGLVLGVGEMGRQVAKALMDAGLSELVICNRTWDGAVHLAAECGGRPVAWERMEDELARADVVLCATGASAPVLSASQVKVALKKRRYDPLFLVDLAVPRNIDPAVANLDEAYLFNVDDLARVLDSGMKAREAASKDAEFIVQQEADKFINSLREIEAGPYLGQIVRKAEVLRAMEVQRSHKLLTGLDGKQREQVDAMTRALVKRLLDGPLRAIREAAREGDTERLESLIEPWEEEE